MLLRNEILGSLRKGSDPPQCTTAKGGEVRALDHRKRGRGSGWMVGLGGKVDGGKEGKRGEGEEGTRFLSLYVATGIAVGLRGAGQL